MKQNRREALATLGAAGLFAVANQADAQVPQAAVKSDFKISKGNIRQSVMGWCFRPMPAIELAKHLGIKVMVTTGGTNLKEDIMRIYEKVNLVVVRFSSTSPSSLSPSIPSCEST